MFNFYVFTIIDFAYGLYVWMSVLFKYLKKTTSLAAVSSA